MVNKIYNPLELKKEKLAKLPVTRLINYLNNNSFHAIKDVFNNANTYEYFYSELGIAEGFVKNNFLEFEYSSIIPQSKAKFSDFVIFLNIYVNEADDALILKLNSSFDNEAQQYFIKNFTLEGDIHKHISNGRLDIDIPQIVSSPCEPDSTDRFSFISLQSRNSNSDSLVVPSQIIGSETSPEIVTVSKDAFFNSQVFRQVKFDKLVDKKKAPDPGYVLSIKDLRESKVKGEDGSDVRLYADIYDAYGVFFLPDANGNLVNFPTGATLDRIWKRVVLSTSQDQGIKFIDGFSDPIAVFILKNYLYVLDEETEKISIYQLTVTGGLTYTLIQETNFGIDLEGASDLTGFSYEDQSILYISNSRKKSIFQLNIDQETGLPADTPLEILNYYDTNGSQINLPGLARFESSSRTEDHILLIGVEKRSNTVYSFRVDYSEASPKFNLVSGTNFPRSFNSKLMNIGYNIGENAFYITDIDANKIHVFSNDGFYLGSGGKSGAGETDNELYFPNAISSNTFANDANEIVVANKWDYNTGFKRIRPLADVNYLEVVEKVPLHKEDSELNELDFRFSLTAGHGVKEIKIELNGIVIRTLNQDNTAFFPNRYSNNVLVSTVNDDLDLGWNNYSVTITSEIPDAGGLLNYSRTKSIDFYHLPSSISEDFSVAGSESSFEHSLEQPFIVYKNIFVSPKDDTDTITFSFSSGKTSFLEKSILYLDKNVRFSALEEEFEFLCGSRIELNVGKGVSKMFDRCSFDGTFQNYNMIACYGEFTGGQGSGSAPSSMMEFIDCNFKNYLGVAVNLKEGRATFANSQFESTINSGAIINPDLTAVAIFASPETRIDIRGGYFLNNDIAIDANDAKLYIGHPARDYKERPVENPLFSKNTIAIHSNGSYSRVKHTQFNENIAAIIDLNGNVEIHQNSQNTFDKNTKAIVFSNDIHGFQGKNLFINNETDISYLITEDVDSLISFDLLCNYWKHGADEYKPVIELISDVEDNPNAGSIDFFTIPYLEKKGNGNNYTCTGGKGGKGGRISFETNRSDEPTVKGTTKINIASIEISEKLKQENYSGAFAILSPMLNNELGNLQMGDYTNCQSLLEVCERASTKNNILSYILSLEKSHDLSNTNLLRKPETIDQLLESKLVSAFPEKHLHTWITQDRLSFLDKIILKEFNTQVVGSEALSTENILKIMLYPNPFSENGTLLLSIHQKGSYSAKIYNSGGENIRTIFSNTQMEIGNHSYEFNLGNNKDGMYLVVVSSGRDIISSSKILKTTGN